MVVISSIENEKVKKLIKLKKRKYRDEEGIYIVEGIHTVREAFRAGMLDYMILEEHESAPFPGECIYVTHEVMAKISTVDTPQTIMGVCHKRDELSDDLLGDKLLILDQIQDPGNLGTIIRSACAFGINTIILSENTVDVYNPKVIRGSQGMLFHINIVQKKSREIINFLKSKNINIYGTKVDGGEDVRSLTAKEREKFALIMGNEGAGVRESISNMCNKNLYIKMNDNVESLNVGVACSILLYELGR